MRQAIVAAAFATLWAGVLAGAGQSPPATSMPDARGHVVLKPDAVKWGPGPPALPAGAEAAILAGDPSTAGQPFTVRLRLPDGYTIPPHWHPVDEHVTVLGGTLMMGLGEKLDAAAMRSMPAGSFGLMPKEVRHFAKARGETTIQVNALGPFEVTYVNPDDDPRKKAGSE